MRSRDFFEGRDDSNPGSAGKERLVCTQAQRRAAQVLPDWQLVKFPDAKHELFLETDTIRERWFKEIDAFIATHVGGAP